MQPPYSINVSTETDVILGREGLGYMGYLI